MRAVSYLDTENALYHIFPSCQCKQFGVGQGYIFVSVSRGYDLAVPCCHHDYSAKHSTLALKIDELKPDPGASFNSAWCV